MFRILGFCSMDRCSDLTHHFRPVLVTRKVYCFPSLTEETWVPYTKEEQDFLFTLHLINLQTSWKYLLHSKYFLFSIWMSLKMPVIILGDQWVHLQLTLTDATSYRAVLVPVWWCRMLTVLSHTLNEELYFNT